MSFCRVRCVQITYSTYLLTILEMSESFSDTCLTHLLHLLYTYVCLRLGNYIVTTKWTNHFFRGNKRRRPMGWWKSLWYSTQGYPPKKCMVDIKDQSEFARKQTYADEATQARFIQDIYLKKSAFSYFHIRLAAKYPRPIRSCTSNMEAQLRAKTTGQLRGFGVLRCKMGDQHRLFLICLRMLETLVLVQFFR